MQNQSQDSQSHVHSEKCGHTRIRHNDHIDYLSNGHMQYVHGTHVDEHVLEVTDINPALCMRIECRDTLQHKEHAEKVPHGDHFDYLINGRLHHVHESHCDDHGPLALV